MTTTVQIWRHYLLGSGFIIETDQESFKELLTQTIQTPDQYFYLSKLMCYDYNIIFNRVKKIE